MNVLDRNWSNCLRMWRWISENLPDGFLNLPYDEKESIIDNLKAIWLKKNRFTNPLSNDCFFCNYDKQHNTEDCQSCPAKLVDPNFHCSGKGHSYLENPLVFYKYILYLNSKRGSE